MPGRRANITNVSPATVSRWAAGKASPLLKTERITSDLRYVFDRLAELYTPDGTRTWHYAKSSLLAGARAIDMIHEGQGDRVLAVIENLADGAHT